MKTDSVISLVGAIIFDGRSLLLGLRSPDRRSCPNTWDVIGGHVEAGETSFAALRRELQEEVGITPTHIRASWTISLHQLVEGVARLDLFLVDRWDGVITRCGSEHVNLRWFNPCEAAALSRLAIEDYRAIFRSLDTDALRV